LIEILLYKQKDTNPHRQNKGRRAEVEGGSTRAEQPSLAYTNIGWISGLGWGVSLSAKRIHFIRRRNTLGEVRHGRRRAGVSCRPLWFLTVHLGQLKSYSFPNTRTCLLCFPWISLSLRVCVFLGVWASQTGIFQSKLHIEFSQQPTENSDQEQASASGAVFVFCLVVAV